MPRLAIDTWRRLFAGATLLFFANVSEAAPGRLRVRGPDLVNESGTVVTLRGCNLGNWFLFEAWMMDIEGGAGEPRDHVDILRTMEARFGAARTRELLEIHRENWIRARDLELIGSFGMNVVRLPFHHALLEDPETPGVLRADAFRWLDHAVQLAAAADIYVILDMHGAPGSQSLDHVTGESGRNEFWLPENRRRAAFLWEAIARRYRDEPTVVAYDLLNEPYGRLNMEHDDAKLVAAMEELVAAVRRADPDKLIYCAGALRGIEIYGPPAARGWSNVGFTEHFYPGFYGDEPSLATQALFLNAKVPQRAALLRSWDAPYLVGEFNPVIDRNGGPLMLRRYFDAFAAQGWAATMWSYKLAKRRGGAEAEPWYLVTNAEPLAPPSFTRSSDSEIEAFFRASGTVPYALAAPQIEALRGPAPPAKMTLAAAGPPPPDASIIPAGWRLWNIGDAYPRGAARWTGQDAISLWGGGRDVIAGRDEFALLAKDVSGDFDLGATVSFDGITHRHAKAGIMFRASEDENAPFVMAHVFPNGRGVLAVRRQPGARIEEQGVLGHPGASRVTLRRRGDEFTAIFGDEHGDSTQRLSASTLPARGLLGYFVLSHDGALSAKVDFSPGEVRANPPDAHPDENTNAP